MGPDDLRHSQAAIAAHPGPHLAYCRPARAPAICGRLRLPRQRPVEETLAAAAAAGYDLTPTRDRSWSASPAAERQAAIAPGTDPRTPAPAAGRTAPRFPRVSGSARASASTSPSSAASRTSQGRLSTPSQAPAAARAWRRPDPSPRGRAAADRPSRCRPAPDSRRRRRQRGDQRRSPAAGPAQRAASPAAISGRVSTSGSRQVRRSIRARASSHQPRTAASQASGGATPARRARRSPRRRARPADRRPGAAHRSGGSGRAREPAPERDEVARGRARVPQAGQRERPAAARASRKAPAARACRGSCQRKARAARPTVPWRAGLQGAASRPVPATGRTGSGSGRSRGHAQRLRIGGVPAAGPAAARRVPAHAERQLVGRPQRAQPRAQLLADVARILGVADHPRRDEHDQLGARLALLVLPNSSPSDRNVAEQRDAVAAALLAVLDQAAQHHGLAALDVDPAGDLALGEGRRQRSSVLLAGATAADLLRDVERDRLVGVDPRPDLEDHAGVAIFDVVDDVGVGLHALLLLRLDRHLVADGQHGRAVVLDDHRRRGQDLDVGELRQGVDGDVGFCPGVMMKLKPGSQLGQAIAPASALLLKPPAKLPLRGSTGRRSAGSR